VTNHAVLIDDSTYFAVISHLMICLGHGLGLKPKQSNCGQAEPCARSFHASLSSMHCYWIDKLVNPILLKVQYYSLPIAVKVETAIKKAD
jgi:hypothetical protein